MSLQSSDIWVEARTYGYHPDTVGLRVLPVLIACRTRFWQKSQEDSAYKYAVLVRDPRLSTPYLYEIPA